MLRKAVTAGLLLALAGCTNVKVEPIASQYKISRLCIEENPKVVVGDFVDGLQMLLRRHSIESQLYTAPVPSSCEYRLTYTAIRSWDLSPYLSDATVRIFKGDQQIGFGHYNLTGEGGFDLSKIASVEEKMAPVINQLLGQGK
ncbi:Sbal_3080 family lipoprotein [Pseudomonas fuscovaginae UPB0736]|uniref:Sbal_3080 family lipoprotein n=1 Tax=Pseudomonas asplenii TaxID=53407 RepID=UPI00028A12F2|nr:MULTISPECIES: Sbal_3080 family lipoprotein [Pseudomonas]UUQ67269.1 Sbal_3080 family lipoprotein [Pseudomonas fuscovaginae UPB0736]UZE29464.1 Sbal_3080 family lipoprotein [Pseudomonas asplenii]